MAINRKELLQLLNMPDEIKLSDGIYSLNQYRKDELLEPLPYNPEMAAQLLEKAGWKDHNGDGIREKDGQHFRFEAIFSSIKDWEKIAIYIQAKLSEVGVRMEVQSLSGGTLRQRIRAGDYQAMFFKFTNDYLQLLQERKEGGYQNPRFFQLWDALNATGDPDEKDRIYQELMILFTADLPITFLFPTVHTYIAHRRICGLSSYVRPDPAFFAEYLWIEEE